MIATREPPLLPVEGGRRHLYIPFFFIARVIPPACLFVCGGELLNPTCSEGYFVNRNKEVWNKGSSVPMASGTQGARWSRPFARSSKRQHYVAIL